MQELKSGSYAPVYLFHGEEPYYIDKLSDHIENHAIEEHERDFNQYVFYGRDLDKDLLIETLKKFPVMAQRQVVIVKEAQDYSGRWADFSDYFSNPVKSTLLVICHKYKKVSGKPAWVEAIRKNGGVVFESSKHYDNELQEVVTRLAREMKYRINPNAAALMAEYLGNEPAKIEMELQKLTINVPLSREIGVDDIHRYIGMSRDFNPFEYINALSTRNAFKSYQIAKFLGENDKNHPVVMIVILLFNHFSKVMLTHSLKATDVKAVMQVPEVRSSYSARQILQAARNYNQRQCALIIEKLRYTDAQVKGVESATLASDEVLKELTYFILNC
ncbi:MAG: DNA polymerase III subunit delta [Salibacteraceae bacterium]